MTISRPSSDHAGSTLDLSLGGAPRSLPARDGKALVQAGPPTHLILQHPVFRTFADPYFRLSDPERVPVFVIQMDGREATLPIRAMMAEFGIDAKDEDGRMLTLVAKALDFVTGLELGDPIPREVLTGEASWQIDDIHRDLAVTRLNLHVLGRTPDGPAPVSDKGSLVELAHTPIGHAELSAGFDRLAKQLGYASPGEVLHNIDQLAGELAYVEALRDWLLRGALRMDRVLTRLARGFSGDYTHKEVLAQIRRLTATGIKEIEDHLAVVDRAVADLPAALGDLAGTTALIRRQRDALYRRWRAWEPYCHEWGRAGARQDTRTWSLTHETYRFLAPRYMTVVEWRTTPEPSTVEPDRAGMRW